MVDHALRCAEQRVDRMSESGKPSIRIPTHLEDLSDPRTRKVTYPLIAGLSGPVRAIVLRCTIRSVRACTIALPELTLAMIALSHANPPAISTEPFVGESAYQGRLVVLHISSDELQIASISR